MVCLIHSTSPSHLFYNIIITAGQAEQTQHQDGRDVAATHVTTTDES